MAKAWINPDDAPVRYVITHITQAPHLRGLRTLTLDATGRNTFETREEAEARMKLMEPQLRAKVLGSAADTLLVVGVQCWPGHHDPKRAVFPGGTNWCEPEPD